MKLKIIRMKANVRIYVLCVFLAMCSIELKGQGFEFKKGWQISSSHSIHDAKLYLDKNQNIYVTGYFGGVVDFDPSSDTAYLTSDTTTGGFVYFLAKYDKNGAFIDVYKLSANAFNLFIADNGNITIWGMFSNSIDIDLGPNISTLTSAGSGDIYYVQYDSDMNLLKGFKIGGKGFDRIEQANVDNIGNFVVSGDFDDIVDFDPSQNSKILTNSVDGGGFVAKYSIDGELIFVFALKENGQTTYQTVDITFDKNNNILIAGSFNGTMDFDPSNSTFNRSSVGIDGVYVKYDANGSFIKAFNYPGLIYDIELDNNGNMYLCGTIPDSMDIDPGAGVFMVYSEKDIDSYISKFDINGNFINGTYFRSNSYYTPTGMEINNNNDIYLYGRIQDSIYFSPNGTNGLIKHNGNRDAYLVKFNPNLEFQYGFNLGSVADDNLYNIALDNIGNIYLTGHFTGKLDLDISNDSFFVNAKYRSVFCGIYKDPYAVGIESNKTNFPVKIFSYNKTIHIDFTELDSRFLNIEIYNSVGKLVASQQHTKNTITELDLFDKPDGVYIVMVSDGINSVYQKLIISSL